MEWFYNLYVGDECTGTYEDAKDAARAALEAYSSEHRIATREEREAKEIVLLDPLRRDAWNHCMNILHPEPSESRELIADLGYIQKYAKAISNAIFEGETPDPEHVTRLFYLSQHIKNKLG